MESVTQQTNTPILAPVDELTPPKNGLKDTLVLQTTRILDAEVKAKSSGVMFPYYQAKILAQLGSMGRPELLDKAVEMVDTKPDVEPDDNYGRCQVYIALARAGRKEYLEQAYQLAKTEAQQAGYWQEDVLLDCASLGKREAFNDTIQRIQSLYSDLLPRFYKFIRIAEAGDPRGRELALEDIRNLASEPYYRYTACYGFCKKYPDQEILERALEAAKGIYNPVNEYFEVAMLASDQNDGTVTDAALRGLDDTAKDITIENSQMLESRPDFEHLRREINRSQACRTFAQAYCRKLPLPELASSAQKINGSCGVDFREEYVKQAAYLKLYERAYLEQNFDIAKEAIREISSDDFSHVVTDLCKAGNMPFALELIDTASVKPYGKIQALVQVAQAGNPRAVTNIMRLLPQIDDPYRVISVYIALAEAIQTNKLQLKQGDIADYTSQIDAVSARTLENIQRKKSEQQLKQIEKRTREITRAKVAAAMESELADDHLLRYISAEEFTSLPGEMKEVYYALNHLLDLGYLRDALYSKRYPDEDSKLRLYFADPQHLPNMDKYMSAGVPEVGRRYVYAKEFGPKVEGAFLTTTLDGWCRGLVAPRVMGVKYDSFTIYILMPNEESGNKFGNQVISSAPPEAPCVYFSSKGIKLGGAKDSTTGVQDLSADAAKELGQTLREISQRIINDIIELRTDEELVKRND